MLKEMNLSMLCYICLGILVIDGYVFHHWPTLLDFLTFPIGWFGAWAIWRGVKWFRKKTVETSEFRALIKGKKL